MVVKDTKIKQKVKNKSWLSIEHFIEITQNFIFLDKHEFFLRG